MKPRTLRWTAPLTLALAAALCASESAERKYSDDEPLGTILNKIAEEIKEHPGDYLERSERVWLMLDEGMTGSPLKEDIDTLLSTPAWRGNGLRQLAWRLYLLGRYDEAEARLRKNIDTGAVGPEQYRMLSSIYLKRLDTLAAQAATRAGWERLRIDEDFISLTSLYPKGGIVPDTLLRSGLRVHPLSSGAHAAVFQAYLQNASAARAQAAAEKRPGKSEQAAGAIWVGRALTVSEMAHSRLWPTSVDWKVRHARALLAAKQPDRAEAVLLGAMDLLESDARLEAGTGASARVRHEIFALLDTARAKH